MLHPSADDLWFVPLGGTGEIGMNLNLYGHDGQWLMVDCGVSFDEPLVPAYKASGLGADKKAFNGVSNSMVIVNSNWVPFTLR